MSGVYELQPGDTLWEIAEKRGMSVDELISFNELTPIQPIHPGQGFMVAPDRHQGEHILVVSKKARNYHIAELAMDRIPKLHF